MRDGLYQVQFQTPLGQGTGVISIIGDHYVGGDGGMAYRGSIYRDGELVSVSLRTIRHTHGMAGVSVLGTDDANMEVAGTMDGDTAELEGQVPGTPAVLQVKLRRLPDF